MTRTKLTLTVLMFVSMGLCSARAQAQGRASAEYLFWHRHNSADQTLIGPSALDADDGTFNFESGYRFSLGYGIGDWDIEAVFADVPDWQLREGATLGMPLIFNDDPMAFLGAGNTLGIRNGLSAAALTDMANVFSLDAGARANFSYESRLRDFQLNIGSNRDSRPYWMAVGWRHLELDEVSALQLTGDFQSTDAMAGTMPGAALDLTSEYTALVGDGSVAGYDPLAAMPTITTINAVFAGAADNDLDGGQIVLGRRFQPRDLVSVEVFTTLGLYQNRAEGTVVETIVATDGMAPEPDDVLQRRFSNADTVASFVGSLGIRWIVPITDYIFFRAGYEGMIVTNVALGPEQSQGLGTTLLGESYYRVKTGGIFVAHGGNLGLGITW